MKKISLHLKLLKIVGANLILATCTFSNIVLGSIRYLFSTFMLINTLLKYTVFGICWKYLPVCLLPQTKNNHTFWSFYSIFWKGESRKFLEWSGLISLSRAFLSASHFQDNTQYYKEIIYRDGCRDWRPRASFIIWSKTFTIISLAVSKTLIGSKFLPTSQNSNIAFSHL